MVNIMVNKKMLFLWSIRDLKKRKLQIIAIAIIIGIGIGTYVGLSSSTEWRQNSFNKSSELLNMYDLKIELATGSWINQSDITNVLSTFSQNDLIENFEQRVDFPTSVNITTHDKNILSKGKIIGIDMSNGSENIGVNGIHITKGRHIKSTDNGENVSILENNFAKYYDIDPEGSKAILSGGFQLDILANGITPEYFMVIEGNLIMAESSFCVLFVPLLTAQKIIRQQIGIPLGYINEVILSINSSISIEETKAEIDVLLTESFPNTDYVISTIEDEPGYFFMKEDISGDQEMYTFFSAIILLTAAFGTYILTSRLVNSQRRQIGINMALGVPLYQISLRYLILSFEIAFLGTIFGFIFSIIIGNAMGDIIVDIAPLPVWETYIVQNLFIQGAILGIIIPILASIVPIINAVRVKPIQAIDTGYTLNIGSGASNIIEKLPLPKSLIIQFPIRNITRSFKRTISSITGIALAICILVTVFAFVDGSIALINSEEEMINKNSPERFEITLNNVYNISTYPVENIISNGKLKETECAIQTPSKLYSEENDIEILLRFQDLNSEIWHPDIIEQFEDFSSAESKLPGILLSQKAIKDLKVNVGSNITVEHLFKKNFYSFFALNTTFKVIGTYSSNIRFWAYVNISESHIMNCSGFTNLIIANPKTGVTIDVIQADLFHLIGFNSIQSVSIIIDTYKELIELFISIFVILQYVVLVMALLITYNTTSIGIEERTRDIATMAAFGTPIWKITRMLIIENSIIGFLGTLIGIFPFGYILYELFSLRIEEALPEVFIPPFITETSYFIIILIGFVAVSLVPLITIKKITKMDLPTSLRVVE